MPKRKTSKLRKTSPFGIFAEDPSFFSHFLIKQEIGEPCNHFKRRFLATCAKPGEDRWNYFFNPHQAKAIFFLVGLRNRWLAREVYAVISQLQNWSFKDLLIFCEDISHALIVTRKAHHIDRQINWQSKRSVWDWAQNRPNTPVYHLELLRYQLLTGNSYQGPFPPNLPTFGPA